MIHYTPTYSEYTFIMRCHGDRKDEKLKFTMIYEKPNNFKWKQIRRRDEQNGRRDEQLPESVATETGSLF